MRHTFLFVIFFLCASVAVFADNVNLNFFVGSDRIHTESVAESGTYTLSTIISGAGIDMSEYECRDYEFVGWKEGSPIASNEVFVENTTITPHNNVNLYAVFRHTDPTKLNGYVRITQTSDLEAGAEYLIVCYYVYGGNQQYYAMTSASGTYLYNGTKYNRLNADELPLPHDGVLYPNGDNSIWTLEGTKDAWKWKNVMGDVTQWLRIGASDQTMLVNTEGSASACTITQANGIFTIRNNANDSILKYVDDYITEEDDYFITGSFTDYVIYLYKKVSAYTSNPDCSCWTVNLNAIDGTVVGTLPASHTLSLTETVAGEGVTLPEAEMTELACDGWEFVGWSIDAPIKSSTTEPEHIIYAGTYEPRYNGVTLYAIFHKSETTIKYTKVTTGSTPADGTYLIVAQDGDNYYAMGNSSTTPAVVDEYYTGSFFSRTYYRDNCYPVSSTMITINASGEIIGDQADAIEWTYGSSIFRNVGNTGVYVNPHRDFVGGSGKSGDRYTYDAYVIGSSVSLTLTRSDDKWAIYTGTYDYATYNTTNHAFVYEYNPTTGYHFYLFKKNPVTTHSYTAYPHCTPYTVFMHACGGLVNGVQNIQAEQVSATSPIDLPSATPACPAEGWEFVGWFPDEDKESFEHVKFTDALAAGTPYIPDHDSTHLYALYRRITDRFRIIDGVEDIDDGDTYIVTFYKNKGGEKYFDYVLSSQVTDGTLKGLEYQSPRDGTGFYLDISDSTGMWTINKVGAYWTFQNLDNNQYLKVTSSGTSTTAGVNAVYLTDKSGTNWAIYVSNNSTVNDYSYEIHCPDGKYVTTQYLTSGYTRYYPHCYIYRRMKEYSSWPHCEPFTVQFDACGGTTEDDGSVKTETTVYAGIELPRAYANADCSKEGWSFAGWATEPLTDETDLQTFDLYPAGTVFHPLATNVTLYAVYHRKTNYYKRITTVGRLHTGTKYIITTPDHKALANMPNDPSDPTAITYTTVTPDASQIITVDNPAIEWRLEGTRGAYELYNVARDVYLDLSEPSEAHLTKTTAVDNFDITYQGSAYLIRSCISIAHYDGNKFLGLNTAGTYFTATDTTKASTRLNIYRQQSSYNSYPLCTEDIDVIKWAKVDEEFNSVTVESYHLKGAPDVHGSYGSPVRQADGTYLVTFRNSILTPCTKAIVEWDGVTSRIRIPYIISENANLSDASVLNGTARDCSECDVYIEPDKTLTVTATDTIRKLYVTDNATLNVANGQTLNVGIMSLFSEGDQAAPIVNLNSGGSIKLRNDELYYDKRIDDNRYYWFSLPFEAHLKEISFVNEAANDGLPQHYSGTDGDNVDRAFFVKYYNGALRADDANGGVLATTYWTDVVDRGSDYTMQAGQGYEIGLANQATKYFNGQDYHHTSRTFRFTMRPGNTWLEQERNSAGSKVSYVTPSACDNEKNAVHGGWNLIGNPYMHTYNTGTVPTDGNIRNGAWVEVMDAYGDGTGKWWILDGSRPTEVPYITLYDPSRPRHTRYSQVLATSYNLRPFEAVFVQVNDGTTLNFASNMSVTSMPAYMRRANDDEPVRTGIMITGAEGMDRTGFVLSENYTPTYEIGADLEKIINSYTKKGVTTYGLNLYSVNADNQQLAFNGLSPAAAQDTIPLGLTCPADGEYTFSFDADWYGVKAKYFESIELIDRQERQSVNLLNSIYSFTASANQVINDRFALVIRIKEQTEALTDFEQTESESGTIRKIIRNGHLFILRDDDIYSATGAKVK